MIVIGSDHTGIKLKKEIIKYLNKNNIGTIDVTDFENQDGDDYPDIAYKISKKTLSENLIGIAICGTGIGISMACNKVIGIRAAVCTDKYMAEMTRKDNDANILCLGSRLDETNVFEIVNAFISTEFQGGRHARRVNKITEIEKSEREGVEYGISI